MRLKCQMNQDTYSKNFTVVQIPCLICVQSVAKSFRAQANLFFMKSVAIIGTGITGLTAAFYLKRQGVPVTVYEAGGRVGGVIQSIRKDGFLAEFGPNTILETSPKTRSKRSLPLSIAGQSIQVQPGQP